MDYPEHAETPRLLLRRWRPSDADAVAVIWSDPAVRDALHPGDDRDPAVIAAGSHAKQVRHWETRGFGIWMATLRDAPTEPPIGWVGAWYPDFVPAVTGDIEIGWTLRRPWWGRGLATEGGRLAIATAFEHLGPPRVISLIAPANARSASVATKLGMHHDSTARSVEDVTLRVFALPRPAS